MPSAIEKLVARLPLEFRVLYRQFLLRVVDLDALSIEADVPRFLGQFAGVLIMISCMRAIGTLFFPPAPSMRWAVEQSALLNMLFVVGLLSVVMWDATFPDRRDVMVLAHLPLKSHMILLAKVTASGALLGLAIVSLNFASGLAWAVVFGNGLGFFRYLAAFWFTIVAASAFLYGSVLALQGLAALVLSRRKFLQFSALAQLAAFGLFMAAYFLEPSLSSRADWLDPANHWLVASSPVFWFVALLNQLNGTLPSELSWLAWRGWIGLAGAVVGAGLSLWLCYVRTMKKTVEEPDLVPGAGGLHWAPRLGSNLQTAILHFSLRSLMRSRQHRVLFAFYWSLVLAIGLSWLHDELSSAGTQVIPTGFLTSTFIMMTFAVFGLRSVFALPISLNANWALQLTQLRPPGKYIATSRLVLLLFGVGPAWVLCGLLALRFRPWEAVVAHATVLALLGWAFVEVGMIRFEKVPFTCSYLPGKANVQVVFWGAVFVLSLLSVTVAVYEKSALSDPRRMATMLALMAGAAVGLCIMNVFQAREAKLYFEEIPPEIITTLGL